MVAKPEHIAEARAALGSQLAAIRKTRGYTQRALTRRLVGYSRSTVANVETGRQHVARDFWAQCDTVLEANGELVAGHDELTAALTEIRRQSAIQADALRRAKLQETGNGEPSTALVSGLVIPRGAQIEASRCTCHTVSHTVGASADDDDGGECPVHRRRFLGATGATLALAALPVDQTAGAAVRRAVRSAPGRLTAEHVRRVDKALLQICAADDEFGGAALLALAGGHLRRVRWWLRSGDYTEQIGQLLWSSAGRVATSAGWLAFDAGDQPEARAFHHEALAAARIARDEPLTVLALAGMSLQATYLRAGREALDMATAAQTSPAAREPRMASVLAVRKARALAQMGDSAASARALGRARAALDRAAPSPESESWTSSWTSFQDHAELTANEGLCRADVGDHAGARRLLEEALDAQDPAYSRNRALYTIRMAHSTLTLGELDEACRLATDALALAGHVGSHRVVDHIYGFRKRTARLASSTAAQEFNDRCDLFLSSRDTA